MRRAGRAGSATGRAPRRLSETSFDHRVDQRVDPEGEHGPPGGAGARPPELRRRSPHRSRRTRIVGAIRVAPAPTAGSAPWVRGRGLRAGLPRRVRHRRTAGDGSAADGTRSDGPACSRHGVHDSVVTDRVLTGRARCGGVSRELVLPDLVVGASRLRQHLICRGRDVRGHLGGRNRNAMSLRCPGRGDESLEGVAHRDGRGWMPRPGVGRW